MKIIHPANITHGGRPEVAIYSIDFHPNGRSLATGGATEPEGDNNLLIWPTAPIWDANATKQAPMRLKCHTGDVNCVRWSHSGKYLASAGDDAVVAIWHRVAGLYVPLAKLAKHADTVLHVDWRLDDEKLVSASADRSLMIWGVTEGESGEWALQTTLRGHTDVVNGCAFSGQSHVASQSNDQSFRVWSVKDSKEIHRLEEPFKGGADNTPFQRLGVPPNNTFVLAVHALNGNGPTIQKIDTMLFTPATDFVGFRSTVSVVRFLPNWVNLHGTLRDTMIWAVGCQDRSVSLWASTQIRPVFVIEELFTDSIFDLSLRGSDSGGIELAACSIDGTVKCISLSRAEVNGVDIQPLTGVVPTDEETAQLVEKVQTSSGTRRRITPLSIAGPK